MTGWKTDRRLVLCLGAWYNGSNRSRTNSLQPARASLVKEWGDFVRQEFPDKAKDVDIAVFADGHVRGHSVTAEVFSNMTIARELTDAVWERIFTLGQGSVDEMKSACRQIQDARDGGPDDARGKGGYC